MKISSLSKRVRDTGDGLITVLPKHRAIQITDHLIFDCWHSGLFVDSWRMVKVGFTSFKLHGETTME